MTPRLLRYAVVLALALVGCGVPSATLVNDGNPAVDGAGPDGAGDAAGAPAMLSGAPTGDTSFGDALVGTPSSAVTYTITNDGDGPSGPLAVTLSDTASFQVVADGCDGRPLARHASCTFDVRFSPSAPGPAAATLRVVASPGGEVARALSGNGLTPGAVDVAEASFDYAGLAVDAAAVTHVFDVTNTGQVAIGMPAPSISGATDSYFVASSTCTAATLAPGDHCAIAVKFDPTTVGDKPGALTVTSAGGGQDVATLAGLAIAHVLVDKAGSTGAGRVQSSQPGLDCGPTCSDQGADFSSSPITLTATPEVGSTFVGWTGDCAGAGSCTLDLVGAKRVTAVFGAITPLLTVTRTGAGAGAVASDVAGIACGATCAHAYPYGATVTLTATPAAGSSFAGWGGACAGTGPCVVMMTAQRDVIATFDSVTPTLTVTLAGAGSGTVTSPSGINCGTACAQGYAYGTMVTLTAAPATGSTFAGWSGTGAGGCTTATTCTVTMTAARDVTATFDKLAPTLTVTRAGAGAGAVTASTGAINCGATCTDTFAYGAMVTLTATPAAGSSFTGWTGAAGCGAATTCTLTMTASQAVTATFGVVTPNLQVNVTGAGTGTVTPNPVGTSCGTTCWTYAYGQMVTLTAAAGGSSTFTGWSGPDAGGCGAASTCTVTMTQARTLTATFDLLTPVLTVSTAGTGAGTVTSSPSGISCPGTCTKTYVINTMVTLTATPATGSTFAGWTGSPTCGATGTCTVPMDHAYTVTATFTALTPALTVTAAGTGAGTVDSSPAGITGCASTGGTCAASFAYGQVVTLTAAATGGATFVGWSGTGAGACAGTATATCAVTMDQARAVTATFNAGPQALAVTLAGTGTGTVTATGISCPGTCSASYAYGTMLTLTAAGTAGSTFTGWSGAGAPAGCTTSATCMVTMDQARAITATFAAGPQTLTVTTSGTGAGAVTSSPTGINCGGGGACSMSQPYGTLVTLTAKPTGTDTFAGWSGACSGTGTCTVTLTAARSVGAQFNAGPRTITVVPAGLGTGRVDSSPAGISACTASGGTCAASFAYNATVTLSAMATGGSSFTGWSGADAGSCAGTATATCAVTADRARSITATFAPGPQLLTVNLPGTGTGTIASNPAGLSCSGAPCSASFAYGQMVQLTATATGGSTFSGWSGGPCTGTGTCTVTMTGAQTVTATFVAGPQALTVTKAGTGAAAGQVKSGDGVITCGAACSSSYPYGTVVSLTATPGAGDSFAGWSGACTGTGTCTVTMDAARSVTATFTAGARTLSVTPTPATGGGVVSSSPAGIASCGAAGGTCSASFASGAMVTLTASPATGYAFSGWTGDCSGAATSCTVTMDAARAVGATFALTSNTLTVTAPANGTIASTAPDTAISCGTACTKAYPYGTMVTLAATPATGYSFGSWSGACAGQGNPCTLTLTAAASVSAAFTLNSYALTVTAPSGGTVASTAPDTAISCGMACSKTYPYGTMVTLAATPATGYSFGSWGGACAGQGNPCTITISAATSVSAAFTLNSYALTVTMPTGGAIASTAPDASINCGMACSKTYTHGTSVTLAANPATGYSFGSWGGACAGQGNPCTVAMTQARAVSATFTVNSYTLTVATPTGGTVTSSDMAISCGATCTKTYAYGSTVTLTATAATGYTFAGWGGACAGTGTCALTISGNTSVSASFTPKPYTITVNVPAKATTRPGDGTGTITSSVGGLSCGNGNTGTCTVTLPYGSAVTLTASPAADSAFAGWGGACSGTATTCALTVAGDATVSGSFSRTSYTLTLSNVDGTNFRGPLLFDDNGVGTLSCDGFSSTGAGSVCTVTYPAGTAVKIQGNFTNGTGTTVCKYKTPFTWSGCSVTTCSPTSPYNTCQACAVTMNADAAVSVTYTDIGTNCLL